MSELHSREHWIDTAQGKLFAQAWVPLQVQGAPIVLLDDSLGCVAGGPAAMQLLQGCGHVPHREQGEVALAAVVQVLCKRR
ncbi:alpha/beta hydrolase [Pseudomonas monteilii]|uniref:alpha/beta hydrolase n=1 Tax=Pseudomonas monteilii TaxID=76759 RepID=UPI001F22CCAD|nr:alpha/beta hydrolase [Pseudomonas monteilii]